MKIVINLKDYVCTSNTRVNIRLSDNLMYVAESRIKKDASTDETDDGDDAGSDSDGSTDSDDAETDDGSTDSDDAETDDGDDADKDADDSKKAKKNGVIPVVKEIPRIPTPLSTTRLLKDL